MTPYARRLSEIYCRLVSSLEPSAIGNCEISCDAMLSGILAAKLRGAPPGLGEF